MGGVDKLWRVVPLAVTVVLAVESYEPAAFGQTVVLSLRSPAPEDAESHLARGEVRYGDAWVPVEKLFQDYRAAGAALKAFDDKCCLMRQRLADLGRQLSEARLEGNSQDLALRLEIAKIRNQQRDYRKTLADKPPFRPLPEPLPLPPQPTQSWRSNTPTYLQAYRNWQIRCELIKRANEEALAKYNQDMTEFNRKQEDIKKQISKMDTTVKQLEEKLVKVAADLKAELQPLLDKQKSARAELQAFERGRNTLTTRLNLVEKAIRSAPEPIRMARGIVEWENAFHDLADLEKLYNETQAEINHIVDQMKAEAAAASRPLPADWRHPQQDRMDILKALIAKAKTARAPAPAP